MNKKPMETRITPKRLTEKEWNKYHIVKSAMMLILAELEYYSYESVLGVLIFDRVDKDYGFVVLKHDKRLKIWRAVDTAASIPTLDEGRAHLIQKMWEAGCTGTAEVDDGPLPEEYMPELDAIAQAWVEKEKTRITKNGN